MRRLKQAVLLSMLCMLPGLAGCAALGVAAHALPPPTLLPQYDKLTGQSVGVMVWADKGIRIDWPSMQLDLASAVQTRLEDGAARDPKKRFLGTSFPQSPASIVRYQQDHPENEGSPIAMIATRLGVSRLIYIEIEEFATRSDLAVDLYRGTASCTIKVIEVAGDQATDAYTENGIATAYPRKAPREGVPNAGDYRIYTGTVDALATEIANRFLPHVEEES